MSIDQLDDIILKYLKNELNIHEQHQLTTWLEENESNRKVLKKVELFWENQNTEANLRKEKVWEKLKEEAFMNEDKNEESSGIRLTISNFVRIAAILTVALIFSFLLYKNNHSEVSDVSNEIQLIEKSTPYGQKSTILLPDGSVVKLNSGSRIIIPEQFSGENRKVELISGEAFFNIEKDKKHPFIVVAGDLNVQVLGTAFNVKAYPEDPHIQVAVDQGKVSVESRNSLERLVLLPDQMATYDIERSTSKKQKFNRKEVLSWTDKTLYFDKATIEDVVLRLEKWYGVEIQLFRKFENKQDFSGEYHDRTLKSVLEGLSYVYKFEYQINGDTVTIK